MNTLRKHKGKVFAAALAIVLAVAKLVFFR